MSDKVKTIISTLRNDYYTSLTSDEVAKLVKKDESIPVLPGPELLSPRAAIAWRPDTAEASERRRAVGLPA